MKGLLTILVVGGVFVALALVTVGWFRVSSSTPRPPADAPHVDVPAPAEMRPPILPIAEEAPDAQASRGAPIEAERVADLERRVEALERALASRRAVAPAAGVEPPGEEALRERVLAWVAEDRAQRAADEAREAEDAQLRQLEFGARYRARTLAHEHDLTTAQEESLVELFVEVEQRRRAIEAAIDVATDDPDEVEARWLVFDEWADQREREVTAQVSTALYEDLYGEE